MIIFSAKNNIMGKICPETSTSSCKYITSSRETFTIWMKSLVFNGYGCTTFDSKGKIAFRIDNYQEKCSSEVYLMDPKGHVLFSFRRKKLSFLGHWNILKWSETDFCKEGTWFRVRKRYVGRWCTSTACLVSPLGFDKSNRSCYKMIKMNKNSAFKIIDSADQLVAEVKQKQTWSGYDLGEDVLSLVVEPHMDYSLVMALVTVYGLINGKL